MKGQVAREMDSYLADFERLEPNGAAGEPSWVRDIRRLAIARFAELGFPTPRHEEWKYTSVAPIARVPFMVTEGDPDGSGVEALVRATVPQAARARLVFVNGRYSAEFSTLRSHPGGLTAESLGAALDGDAGSLEPHLARYAGYREHPFVALNTAFVKDGAFVLVPKGAVVEEPIYLVFLSTSGGQPRVSHPRTLVVLEDGSQATVVEMHVGAAAQVYFTNAVTEIAAGQNAVLRYYKVQQESLGAFHVATIQAYLARSSGFSSVSFDLGGALVRNDVNAVLDGEGVDCSLDGLYAAAAQQHVDNHTRIDHVKPNCSSRELYKGILDGKSRGVFNGKIFVHRNAVKTDAKQANKNLLLSEDAVINTKPQLEIYADDVRCTHGSTIGQLDQDAVFYLRSRGIDLATARDLLTYAFASEMIHRVTVEPVRAQLEGLLLGGASAGGWEEGGR
jgi:Fe-S cluster assembly protein SufD